jgi:predicted dehydrogenase
MPPEARRYRGIIIGGGQIAERAHLPGFRDHPGAASQLEIVGIVDSKRVGFVAGLPIVPDLDAVARFEPIDFVDICTPTSSHVELILAGLARGYHVLCEKPVAVTKAEAETIARAAERAGRHVMACHQYRFNPAWLQVKAWLDEGRIGPWRLAEFHVYRLEADRGSVADQVPWRGRKDEARGGIVLDHGTHLIYEILDAAGGPPQSIHGWSGRVKHAEYDVEDTAQVVLQFADRLGVLFLTWAAHHRETRIRFVGDRGSIEWRGGLLELATDAATERLDFTSQLDKASYAGWFGALFQQFAGVLASKAPDAGLLADIAQVAGVLEAIYENSRVGAVADR